jgi:hypothetical protein
MKYIVLLLPIMCYSMDQGTQKPNFFKCNKFLGKMEIVMDKMNREISDFESKEQYQKRMLYLEGKLEMLQNKLHEHENGY